jgi:acetyltransferase-like isoleucine patch superfamily enzyme
MVNRLGLGRFRQIGRGVRFNGWVRVEKPGGDIRLGDDCMIGRGCYFLATATGLIHLDRNVGVNDHCYITSNYGISIGKDVRIAEFVSIRDYDHEFTRTDVPICDQGLRGGPITIGDDVWIGRGVMITGNVRIGRGCVIGANSVVTRDLPDWSIAVGAPARVIKARKVESSQD